MLVQLQDEFLGCYSVKPVDARHGDGEFFQTDTDFPALARSWGWRGKIGRERCDHRKTDGTVDCPDCGVRAWQFIDAAGTYLDGQVGRVRRI